ncbi:Glycosyl transferases group 1 [Clavibacter michiganensis]|uniref:Glycosyl transferases group 1 n=1 Tax=Clavibacter michiganensis TaxID=28447 RepID=A0A251XXD1_9MICO|nr:Glycosyl transferases group 1 [Clavibacter michiganensis]
MRILMWHVHGGWTDSFVLGGHEVLLPATPARDAWGLGRGGRDWPASAREVDPALLHETAVDLVLLQRVAEVDEAERLLGRRLGTDVAAVYLEHNTPRGAPTETVHPLAGRADIPVVHVTRFNALMWDTGIAPTAVVEHGVPDPGPLYTGEVASLGAVINEPVRRGRITGTDLLPAFAAAAPVEVFGMGTDLLPAAFPGERGPGLDGRLVPRGDVPTSRMHPELARLRAYVHPHRWTSLGLSLLEAMHMAMPVLVLDATEASRAVPPDAGAISADPADLVRAARLLVADPDEAARRGRIAREAALARYSLGRFLRDMDVVMHDAVDAAAGRRARRTPVGSAAAAAAAGSPDPHHPHPQLDERTTR